MDKKPLKIQNEVRNKTPSSAKQNINTLYCVEALEIKGAIIKISKTEGNNKILFPEAKSVGEK
jgi:hypothetical protein